MKSFLLFAALPLLLSACNKSEDVAPPGATSEKIAPKPSAASASSAPAPAVSAVPEPPKELQPLNVLLLTVDSLRADMPWTTYDKPIAPNLTALAKESTVYTNAYSVSSYTAKSVGTLLTGLYPSSLYRSGYFFTGYSGDNEFITEILQKRGVHTMGLHAHMYFGKGKNLDQGFDDWRVVPGIAFDAETDNNVTSDKVTALGIELLSSERVKTSQQWFAWFHYMDPHDQYIRHEETPDFGKNNRGRYDSEVHFTDQHIGKLLAFAKTQPWWDRTAIIVSADHGEAFGEHGRHKHAFDVWEVLTRVPLIIRVPGGKPQVIEQRRSHIDVAPTVLDLMRQNTDSTALPGKSLAPEVTGKSAPLSHEPIVLDLPEDTHNPPLRAIIAGDYKLTVHGADRKFELYNLKADPAEDKDLAREEPAKLEEMKQLFQKTWSSIPQIKPFGGMKLKQGGTATGPRGRDKP